MKIKDKYYKETEYLLYNYKMYEIAIENMKKEIEYLEKEDEARSIGAIRYDGTKTSPTFKISSITEDTVLSISEKIAYFNHSIEGLKLKLKVVDNALKGLTDTERIIITDRYIHGKQWYIVAYNAKYSERHCKRMRTDAIIKLAIGLNGDKAIEI